MNNRLRACTGRLLRAEAARVITVSAIASRWRSGALVDLAGEQDYRPMRAYAKSKFTNVVFTEELNRRAAGTGLIVAAAHPGTSNTSGEFIGPTGRGEVSGTPGVVRLPEYAADPEIGRTLWDVSTDLTQVTYDFAAFEWAPANPSRPWRQLRSLRKSLVGPVLPCTRRRWPRS
ncbi:MAG TPA: hypothetical protein VHW44_20040 [Pseudonocardiaceae bacterium]|jgi:NAD(P)-dependent dehydrogenase (short-subunit alcohol dehydrogenase family)|nr:hypothetical protein [Pseudonocardiaceae bacterium]